MRRERVRATHSWRKGDARYDCVFVEADPAQPGFRGLLVARVFLFFSLKHEGDVYPCALIRWYSAIDTEPDEETGMWIIQPDEGDNGLDVIHLDTMLRCAHLIGVAGNSFIPKIKFTESLNAFKAFYVNKYADYHAHEIAF